MTDGLPARDDQVTPGMMITEIRRLTSRAEVAERQIAHLADRLSVVHVQVQGDAKIRTERESSIVEPSLKELRLAVVQRIADELKCRRWKHPGLDGEWLRYEGVEAILKQLAQDIEAGRR